MIHHQSFCSQPPKLILMSCPTNTTFESFETPHIPYPQSRGQRGIPPYSRSILQLKSSTSEYHTFLLSQKECLKRREGRPLDKRWRFAHNGVHHTSPNYSRVSSRRSQRRDRREYESCTNHSETYWKQFANTRITLHLEPTS